jgi:hypothetical protein
LSHPTYETLAKDMAMFACLLLAYYIILDEAPVRGQKGQLEYARRHSSKYIVFLEQFRLADELIEQQGSV